MVSAILKFEIMELWFDFGISRVLGIFNKNMIFLKSFWDTDLKMETFGNENKK